MEECSLSIIDVACVKYTAYFLAVMVAFGGFRLADDWIERRWPEPQHSNLRDVLVIPTFAFFILGFGFVFGWLGQELSSLVCAYLSPRIF